MTNIEWTHGEGYQGKTWNVVVGCSPVSAGCKNCYAINEARRMGSNPHPKISSVYAGLTERKGDRTEWTGEVRFIPERLDIPLKTRKPTMWFVNSMADLFHELVTDEQLKQVWEVMHEAHKRYGHIFQLLTKRPDRMAKALGPDGIGWYAKNGNVSCPEPGIWLGVSVENQKAADDRIPLLLQTPAVVRFLSCEPLLGELELEEYLRGIDYAPDSLGHQETSPGVNWVICGGESGNNARECDLRWLQSIVMQCKSAGVPVFVKQLGSHALTGFESISEPPGLPAETVRVPVPYTTSDRKGGNIEEFPKDLQVRQFPAAGAV